MNAERVGKREVALKPVSKMMKQVLEIMNEHHYVGSYEETQDGQAGLLKINLLGNINKCGVIKPRFSAPYRAFEKWEKRYLPAKDFGILVVSTPLGVMTHIQAKEKKMGGKLLAFCY